MSIFLSELEMVDCVIENINMTTTIFRITSSVFTLRNTVLQNISYSIDADLMFANLDNNIVIDSLNFTNSSTNLLNSRNSNVTINTLYMENIEYEKSIIQILQSDNVKVNEIIVANVNILNEQPIIGISSSIDIQMSTIIARNIDETVLKISSSTVDMIDSFIVQN